MAGGLAVLGLTGCELDPRGARPTPSAAPSAELTAGAPTAPSEDDDLAVLDQARSAVTVMLGAVRATRRRHAPLRPALAPLQRLHQRHLTVLAGAGRDSESATPGPSAVRPRAGRALADVRAAEDALQTRLADLAVEAGSGDFARLLAAMSAGVAQAVTALPEGP